jgi:hypothetical protein
MSEQRNPRYFSSQWFASKMATEPRPAAWYWHDETYEWFGPYETEQQARDALSAYERAHSLNKYRKLRIKDLLDRIIR